MIILAAGTGDIASDVAGGTEKLACIEYSEEMIFSYAADELDGENARKLKAHIEICAECRKTYEECGALLSDVKKSGEEVPEELLSGVMAKVRGEKTVKHTPWKKLALIAACIAIIACVFAVSLNVGKTDMKNDVELLADEMVKEPAAEETKAKEAAPDLDAADGVADELYNMCDKAETEASCATGSFCCPYHTGAYHNVPQYLIKYVGDGAYEQWRLSLEETLTECPAVKLYDFIVYFDIPEEVLRECYVNEGLEDEWDIEALCSRDEAKWEAFCGMNG